MKNFIKVRYLSTLLIICVILFYSYTMGSSKWTHNYFICPDMEIRGSVGHLKLA
ncbi:MAG: hypothetical protein Q8M15_04630 [Bacteroidota bacterium]|nr:hypothetical protein [Bacteroidota bacterium]